MRDSTASGVVGDRSKSTSSTSSSLEISLEGISSKRARLSAFPFPFSVESSRPRACRGLRAAPVARQSRQPPPGGTIRAGIIVPAGAINPITIADEGGLELLGNVGEFLVVADQSLGY